MFKGKWKRNKIKKKNRKKEKIKENKKIDLKSINYFDILLKLFSFI